MPQIILRFSENITGVDFAPFFKKLHLLLAEITDPNTCKSRTEELKNCYLGNGDPKNAMIHIEIAILKKPERTDALKEAIGKRIMQLLVEELSPQIARLGLNPFMPTIEIRDLEKYFISSTLITASNVNNELHISSSTSHIPKARM